jgi:hypothetical protein
MQYRITYCKSADPYIHTYRLQICLKPVQSINNAYFYFSRKETVVELAKVLRSSTNKIIYLQTTKMKFIFRTNLLKIALNKVQNVKQWVSYENYLRYSK